jgi:hypothetical protein
VYHFSGTGGRGLVVGPQGHVGGHLPAGGRDVGLLGARHPGASRCTATSPTWPADLPEVVQGRVGRVKVHTRDTLKSTATQAMGTDVYGQIVGHMVETSSIMAAGATVLTTMSKYFVRIVNRVTFSRPERRTCVFERVWVAAQDDHIPRHGRSLPTSQPAHRLLVSIAPGPVPGEARSRCPGRRSHIGCPRLVVWLSHGLRDPGIDPEQGEAQERFAQLEVAVPSRARQHIGSSMEERMAVAESARVVVGMDPHKRSVTIEVMAASEKVLGGGRFGTDITGYRSMLDYLKRWPSRVLAIEGCSGIGRHVALRLLADGQEVVDVPP